MKQDSKKKLYAYFIILMFMMSTFAFFVFQGGGHGGSQDIRQYVYENNVDPTFSDYLVRSGFTVINYNYSDIVKKEYVASVPDKFLTGDDMKQVVVILSESDFEYLDITSIKGNKILTNISQETIDDTVCEFILVESPLC